jgi:hypothetical protein
MEILNRYDSGWHYDWFPEAPRTMYMLTIYNHCIMRWNDFLANVEKWKKWWAFRKPRKPIKQMSEEEVLTI